MTESAFSGTIFNVPKRKDLKDLETRTEAKKTKKKGYGEGLFCLLMLLFAVFEIFLLVTVLVRSFTTAEALEPDGTEESSSEESTPEEESTTDGEQLPSSPVFAGGTIPTHPATNAGTQTVTGINSQYAVLVNVETGAIVAQKNADTKFSPASMTKVMTLIVACENLTKDELDQKLTMTQEIYDYVRADGYADSTLYGIDVGDEYSLRDLLYGIGMESASDCVIPVVLYISETEQGFVALMNRKAEQMGLENTLFDNAIGHDSENNYTTAEDMAVIMAYAMQSELIADILGKEVYKSTAAGYNSQGVFLPSFPFTFYSSLFGDHAGSRMKAYKDKYGVDFRLNTAELIAGKTGWTTDNYCLVSYAEGDDGAEYVLVLAKGSAKYETMRDVKTVFDTYVK